MPSFSDPAILGLAQILATALAGVGLFTSALTLHLATRQARLQRLIELQDKIYSDTELRDLYYQVEYGTYRYDTTQHHSAQEKVVDRLLILLDSVARLYEAKMLSRRDLGILDTTFTRVFQNDQIQKYLAFLEPYWTATGNQDPPLGALRRVGEQLSQKKKKETGFYLFRK